MPPLYYLCVCARMCAHLCEVGCTCSQYMCGGQRTSSHVHTQGTFQLLFGNRVLTGLQLCPVHICGLQSSPLSATHLALTGVHYSA